MASRSSIIRGLLVVALAIRASVLMAAEAQSYDPGNDRPIHLKSFTTHSRLVIRIDDGTQTQWKDVPGGFELFFKGMMLADLGAPLGAEEAWGREIQKMAEKAGDPRLASLAVREEKGGLRLIGKWRFPKGEQAPAEPKMERFDYRDKALPAYVVDFWPKKGPTLAEVKQAKFRAAREAQFRAAEKRTKERRERRLASEELRQGVKNTTRFCQEPFDEAKDIFLPFGPLHEPVNFSRWFSSNTADENYKYLQPTGDGEDAKYVRLALDLYSQGKPALVLKTLDFFDAEQPNSKFKLEMQFLRANAMIRLGLRAEAMRILKDIVAVAKDSSVALYAGMYVAVKTAESGNHLAAMESFLWLIQNYPSHRLNWVFHLGVAESLYAMKQTDRAAKEYQWVIMNGPDRQAQAEGAARMGDIYLIRRQYERALAAYYQAIKHYKTEMKKFPAVFVNRAESLYWLKIFDRAESAYREFLAAYENHPSAWRAMYRMGEVVGRKPGAKAREESRKWFLDTVNRFPFSPGATLARARVLPCDDHGGFDLLAAERYFGTEAAKFTGEGDILMDRYQDYRALARVRTLISMGREDMAVSAAIQELEGKTGSAAREILSETLGTLFRKLILTMLSDGKRYEALNLYREKAGFIPPGRPEEMDYLLKLSQAASDLGMGSMAIQLAEEHTKATTAPDRKIASHEIDLRMAEAERHYSRAKALWVSKGAAADAEIREQLGFVLEESEFSYDREVLLGLLDDKKGRHESALKHLSRAQMLLPTDGKNGDDADRLEYFVATLTERAGDPMVSARIYGKLLKGGAKRSSEGGTQGRGGALGLPPVPAAELLMIAQGDILAKHSKWGEAAAAYGLAVKEGLGGNHAMYKYAQALTLTGGSGDQEKARGLLETLAKSKTEDFWSKLARERLAGPEFTDVRNDAKEGRK